MMARMDFPQLLAIIITMYTANIHFLQIIVKELLIFYRFDTIDSVIILSHFQYSRREMVF